MRTHEHQGADFQTRARPWLAPRYYTTPSVLPGIGHTPEPRGEFADSPLERLHVVCSIYAGLAGTLTHEPRGEFPDSPLGVELTGMPQ